MVSQFPVDYAHCAVLGVMRKLLLLFVNGPYRTRLGRHDLTAISNRLTSYAEYCPSEFARRPRSLTHLLNWKATEFRAFMCFTGVAALRNIVEPEVYGNYLMFSMGMRILLTPDDHIMRNALAKELLSKFVEHAIQLYGERVATYNMHVLTHLSDEAYVYGNLYLISAFPFENFLYKLKRMLRKPGSTLQQVVNRTYESRALSLPRRDRGTKFMYAHQDGPLPIGYTHCQQFKAVVTEAYRYGTSVRDCCVKTLTDTRIGLVRNVLRNGHEVYLALNLYDDISDLYTNPVRSSDFSIYSVGELNPVVVVRDMDDCHKCFRMPLSESRGTFVVSALLHDM